MITWIVAIVAAGLIIGFFVLKIVISHLPPKKLSERELERAEFGAHESPHELEQRTEAEFRANLSAQQALGASGDKRG